MRFRRHRFVANCVECGSSGTVRQWLSSNSRPEFTFRREDFDGRLCSRTRVVEFPVGWESIHCGASASTTTTAATGSVDNSGGPPGCRDNRKPKAYTQQPTASAFELIPQHREQLTKRKNPTYDL